MTTKTDREMLIELYQRIEKLEKQVESLQQIQSGLALTVNKVDTRTKKDIVFGSAGRNK